VRPLSDFRVGGRWVVQEPYEPQYRRRDLIFELTAENAQQVVPPDNKIWNYVLDEQGHIFAARGRHPSITRAEMGVKHVQVAAEADAIYGTGVVKSGQLWRDKDGKLWIDLMNGTYSDYGKGRWGAQWDQTPENIEQIQRFFQGLLGESVFVATGSRLRHLPSSEPFGARPDPRLWKQDGDQWVYVGPVMQRGRPSNQSNRPLEVNSAFAQAFLQAPVITFSEFIQDQAMYLTPEAERSVTHALSEIAQLESVGGQGAVLTQFFTDPFWQNYGLAKGYYLLHTKDDATYPLTVENGELTTASMDAIRAWYALQATPDEDNPTGLNRAEALSQFDAVHSILTQAGITLPREESDKIHSPVFVYTGDQFNLFYPNDPTVAAFYDESVGGYAIRSSVSALSTVQRRMVHGHEISHDMVRYIGPIMNEDWNEGVATAFMVALVVKSDPSLTWVQAETIVNGFVSSAYWEKYLTVRDSRFGELLIQRGVLMGGAQRAADALLEFYKNLPKKEDVQAMTYAQGAQAFAQSTLDAAVAQGLLLIESERALLQSSVETFFLQNVVIDDTDIDGDIRFDPVRRQAAVQQASRSVHVPILLSEDALPQEQADGITSVMSGDTALAYGSNTSVQVRTQGVSDSIAVGQVNRVFGEVVLAELLKQGVGEIYGLAMSSARVVLRQQVQRVMNEVQQQFPDVSGRDIVIMLSAVDDQGVTHEIVVTNTPAREPLVYVKGDGYVSRLNDGQEREAQVFAQQFGSAITWEVYAYERPSDATLIVLDAEFGPPFPDNGLTASALETSIWNAQTIEDYQFLYGLAKTIASNRPLFANIIQTAQLEEVVAVESVKTVTVAIGSVDVSIDNSNPNDITRAADLEVLGTRHIRLQAGGSGIFVALEDSARELYLRRLNSVDPIQPLLLGELVRVSEGDELIFARPDFATNTRLTLVIGKTADGFISLHLPNDPFTKLDTFIRYPEVASRHALRIQTPIVNLQNQQLELSEAQPTTAPAGPDAPEKPRDKQVFDSVVQSLLDDDRMYGVHIAAIQTLPNGPQIIDYLKRRFVDHLFQKSFPVADVADGEPIYERVWWWPFGPRRVSQARRQAILNELNTPRPQIEVLRSFVLPRVAQQEGNTLMVFDIDNARLPNGVNSTAKYVFGDIHIYDVVAAIEQELQDGSIRIIRNGGDEFVLDIDGSIDADAVGRRIAASAQRTKALFFEKGKIVYRNAGVHGVAVMSADDRAFFQSLGNTSFSTLPILVTQLRRSHSELGPFIDTIQTLPEQDQLGVLRMLEELLFDAKLQSQVYSSSTLDVDGFVDADDFSEHLASEQQQGMVWRMMRLELPGLAKLVNDTDGHVAGDRLLQYVAARLLGGLQAGGLTSVRILRSGSDFYFAYPESEKVRLNTQFIKESITQALTAEGPYAITGTNVPLIPVIADMAVDFSALVDGQRPEDVFDRARQTLSEAGWHMLLTTFAAYLGEANSSETALQYIASYFNPNTARGASHLARIEDAPSAQLASLLTKVSKAPLSDQITSANMTQAHTLLRDMLIRATVVEPEDISTPVEQTTLSPSGVPVVLSIADVITARPLIIGGGAFSDIVLDGFIGGQVVLDVHNGLWGVTSIRPDFDIALNATSLGAATVALPKGSRGVLEITDEQGVHRVLQLDVDLATGALSVQQLETHAPRARIERLGLSSAVLEFARLLLDNMHEVEDLRLVARRDGSKPYPPQPQKAAYNGANSSWEWYSQFYDEQTWQTMHEAILSALSSDEEDAVVAQRIENTLGSQARRLIQLVNLAVANYKNALSTHILNTQLNQAKLDQLLSDMTLFGVVEGQTILPDQTVAVTKRRTIDAQIFKALLSKTIANTRMYVASSGSNAINMLNELVFGRDVPSVATNENGKEVLDELRKNPASRIISVRDLAGQPKGESVILQEYVDAFRLHGVRKVSFTFTTKTEIAYRSILSILAVEVAAWNKEHPEDPVKLFVDMIQEFGREPEVDVFRWLLVEGIYGVIHSGSKAAAGPAHAGFVYISPYAQTLDAASLPDTLQSVAKLSLAAQMRVLGNIRAIAHMWSLGPLYQLHGPLGVALQPVIDQALEEAGLISLLDEAVVSDTSQEKVGGAFPTKVVRPQSNNDRSPIRSFRMPLGVVDGKLVPIVDAKRLLAAWEKRGFLMGGILEETPDLGPVLRYALSISFMEELQAAGITQAHEAMQKLKKDLDQILPDLKEDVDASRIQASQGDIMRAVESQAQVLTNGMEDSACSTRVVSVGVVYAQAGAPCVALYLGETYTVNGNQVQIPRWGGFYTVNGARRMYTMFNNSLRNPSISMPLGATIAIYDLLGREVGMIRAGDTVSSARQGEWVNVLEQTDAQIVATPATEANVETALLTAESLQKYIQETPALADQLARVNWTVEAEAQLAVQKLVEEAYTRYTQDRAPPSNPQAVISRAVENILEQYLNVQPQANTSDTFITLSRAEWFRFIGFSFPFFDTIGSTYVTSRAFEKDKSILLRALSVLSPVIEGVHISTPDRTFSEKLSQLQQSPEYARIEAALHGYSQSAPTNTSEGDLVTLLNNAILAEFQDRDYDNSLYDELQYTEEDVIESALFIDQEYYIPTLLSGKEDVRLLFGGDAWEGWKAARAKAKTISLKTATLEDIVGIHAQMFSEKTGFRNITILGGAFISESNATTLTEEQIVAITNNPYLRWIPSGRVVAGTQRGKILYPTIENGFSEEDIRTLLGENYFEQFIQEGKTNAALVKLLLAHLLSWYQEEIRKDDADVVGIAAEFARRFVSIHPFRDGNGRLSRILMNMILEENGSKPSILAHPERDYFYTDTQWKHEVQMGISRYEDLTNVLETVDFTAGPVVSDISDQITAVLLRSLWVTPDAPIPSVRFSDLPFEDVSSEKSVYRVPPGSTFRNNTPMGYGVTVVRKKLPTGEYSYSLLGPDEFNYESKWLKKLFIRLVGREYDRENKATDQLVIGTVANRWGELVSAIQHVYRLAPSSYVPLEHDQFEKSFAAVVQKWVGNPFGMYIGSSRKRIDNFGDLTKEGRIASRQLLSQETLWRGAEYVTDVTPEGLVKYFTTVLPETVSYRVMYGPEVTREAVQQTLRDANGIQRVSLYQEKPFSTYKQLIEQEFHRADEYKVGRLYRLRILLFSFIQKGKHLAYRVFRNHLHVGSGGRLDNNYQLSPFVSATTHQSLALLFAMRNTASNRNATRILWKLKKPTEGYIELYKSRIAQTALIGAVDPNSIEEVYQFNPRGEIISSAHRIDIDTIEIRVYEAISDEINRKVFTEEEMKDFNLLIERRDYETIAAWYLARTNILPTHLRMTYSFTPTGELVETSRIVEQENVAFGSLNQALVGELKAFVEREYRSVLNKVNWTDTGTVTDSVQVIVEEAFLRLYQNRAPPADAEKSAHISSVVNKITEEKFVQLSSRKTPYQLLQGALSYALDGSLFVVGLIGGLIFNFALDPHASIRELIFLDVFALATALVNEITNASAGLGFIGYAGIGTVMMSLSLMFTRFFVKLFAQLRNRSLQSFSDLPHKIWSYATAVMLGTAYALYDPNIFTVSSIVGTDFLIRFWSTMSGVLVAPLIIRMVKEANIFLDKKGWSIGKIAKKMRASLVGGIIVLFAIVQLFVPNAFQQNSSKDNETNGAIKLSNNVSSSQNESSSTCGFGLITLVGKVYAQQTGASVCAPLVAGSTYIITRRNSLGEIIGTETITIPRVGRYWIGEKEGFGTIILNRVMHEEGKVLEIQSLSGKKIRINPSDVIHNGVESVSKLLNVGKDVQQPNIHAAPNQASLSQWVNAHRVISVDGLAFMAAQFVQKHISYIDFARFKNALQNAVSELFASLQQKPYVLISLPAEGEQKSDYWVQQLAFNNGENLPQGVVSADGIIAWLKVHPEVKDIVYMDDASYSGSQVSVRLQTTLSDAFQYCPDCRFHVVIPFFTNAARERIQSSYKTQVVFYGQEEIPTLDELLVSEYENTDTYQGLKEQIINHLGYDRNTYDGLTLTYFQHKMPDGYSVLQVLSDGALLASGNGSTQQSIPFIFPIVPPYKGNYGGWEQFMLQNSAASVQDQHALWVQAQQQEFAEMNTRVDAVVASAAKDAQLQQAISAIDDNFSSNRSVMILLKQTIRQAWKDAMSQNGTRVWNRVIEDELFEKDFVQDLQNAVVYSMRNQLSGLSSSNAVQNQRQSLFALLQLELHRMKHIVPQGFGSIISEIRLMAPALINPALRGERIEGFVLEESMRIVGEPVPFEQVESRLHEIIAFLSSEKELVYEKAIEMYRQNIHRSQLLTLNTLDSEIITKILESRFGKSVDQFNGYEKGFLDLRTVRELVRRTPQGNLLLKMVLARNESMLGFTLPLSNSSFIGEAFLPSNDPSVPDMYVVGSQTDTEKTPEIVARQLFGYYLAIASGTTPILYEKDDIGLPHLSAQSVYAAYLLYVLRDVSAEELPLTHAKQMMRFIFAHEDNTQNVYEDIDRLHEVIVQAIQTGKLPAEIAVSLVEAKSFQEAVDILQDSNNSLSSEDQNPVPTSSPSDSQFSAVVIGGAQSPEAIRNGEEIYAEAIQYLQRYMPSFVPTEPTVMFIVPSDLAGGGEYLGVFEGKHYLDIGFPNKPDSISPWVKKLLVFLTVHELIHQKQFEIENTASVLPDLSLSVGAGQLTPEQLRDELLAHKQDIVLSDLQDALLEGFAVDAELAILDEEIGRADGEERTILTAARSERLKLIESEPYKSGRDMVSKLVSSYGRENFFSVMQAINFGSLGELNQGAVDYADLQNDPTKLPGLESVQNKDQDQKNSNNSQNSFIQPFSVKLFLQQIGVLPYTEQQYREYAFISKLVEKIPFLGRLVEVIIQPHSPFRSFISLYLLGVGAINHEPFIILASQLIYPEKYSETLIELVKDLVINPKIKRMLNTERELVLRYLEENNISQEEIVEIIKEADALALEAIRIQISRDPRVSGSFDAAYMSDLQRYNLADNKQAISLLALVSVVMQYIHPFGVVSPIEWLNNSINKPNNLPAFQGIIEGEFNVQPKEYAGGHGFIQADISSQGDEASTDSLLVLRTSEQVSEDEKTTLVGQWALDWVNQTAQAEDVLDIAREYGIPWEDFFDQKVAYGDATAYVHKPVFVDGRWYSFGIVRQGERVSFRAFYKSYTGETWRVAPAIEALDGRTIPNKFSQVIPAWIFNKGIAEYDTVLPTELQQALEAARLSQEQKSQGIYAKILDVILPSDFKTPTEYVQDIQAPTQFATEQNDDPKTWRTDDPADMPDFDRGALATYKALGGAVGKSPRTKYVFASKNNRLAYTINYFDETGEYQVDAVEDLGAPINSYGVRSRPLDPAGLTRPVVEKQGNGDLAGATVISSTEVNQFAIQSQNPVLVEFDAWVKKQLRIVSDESQNCATSSVFSGKVFAQEASQTCIILRPGQTYRVTDVNGNETTLQIPRVGWYRVGEGRMRLIFPLNGPVTFLSGSNVSIRPLFGISVTVAPSDTIVPISQTRLSGLLSFDLLPFADRMAVSEQPQVNTVVLVSQDQNTGTVVQPQQTAPVGAQNVVLPVVPQPVAQQPVVQQPVVNQPVAQPPAPVISQSVVRPPTPTLTPRPPSPSPRPPNITPIPSIPVVAPAQTWTMPKFTLPKLSLPKITMLKITLSTIQWPKITLPTVRIPNIDIASWLRGLPVWGKISGGILGFEALCVNLPWCKEAQAVLPTYLFTPCTGIVVGDGYAVDYSVYRWQERTYNAPNYVGSYTLTCEEGWVTQQVFKPEEYYYNIRGQYLLNDQDFSHIERELEETYGIIIASEDAVPIEEDQLRALADALDLLPANLKQTNYSEEGLGISYVFIFGLPPVFDDEGREAFMWTSRYVGINANNFGNVFISEKAMCHGTVGSCDAFIENYIHEILHNHDTDVVTSPYCRANFCNVLDAFVEAAEQDGVTFSFGGDVRIKANGDPDAPWYVREEFPDTEMFAYLGSRYATEPETIQQQYPNLYEFYRDSVYDGREYAWTNNSQTGEQILVVQ
jgi:GGDEF domain-containing protein/prophage maintenance system killer protein